MQRKPVNDTTLREFYDRKYMYFAKYHKVELHKDVVRWLGSDSLINLKKEVKARGWRLVWIIISEGVMTYGQQFVTEYPYMPKL